jgi:hypothetical protein
MMKSFQWFPLFLQLFRPLLVVLPELLIELPGRLLVGLERKGRWGLARLIV